METLDLSDQKVDCRTVRFVAIGTFEDGTLDLRHCPRHYSDHEVMQLLHDQKYLYLLEHDAPYRNGWLRGMLAGMAVTAAIWGALWVVGKLVFG